MFVLQRNRCRTTYHGTALIVELTHGLAFSRVALPLKPALTTHADSPSRPVTPATVPTDPNGHDTRVHVRFV